MATIFVYTSVAGGYENRLYAPRHRSANMRFVCFSDHPRLESNGWELREPVHPAGIERPDLVNRYHKFFAYDLFPEAAYSIYVDANLQITGNLSSLVAQLHESRALLGAARHPERDSYLEEIEICVQNGKFKGDDAQRALAQKARYQQAGLAGGLLAAGLLVRSHGSAELRAAMELWWEQVLTYTARDQISLPYVLWKTRLPHTVYDFNILRDNQYTSIHGHGESPSALRYMKRRLMRSLRNLAGSR